MVAHRFPALAIVAVLAATAAVPALAAHGVVNAPSATAAGNSASGGQGIFDIRDGAVVTNIVGGTASVDIGTVTPTAASGAAISTGNFFGTAFGGAASAGADLATGILKARVDGYGPSLSGFHVGIASASLADTILFTNTSGGDLAFTFRYRFDGVIADPNAGGTLAKAQLAFRCLPASCFNDANEAIRFAGTGTLASDSITAYMDEGGISSFARNDFGDQLGLFERFDVWQANPHGSGGASDGWMQARLLIPNGLTSLGVFGSLSLDCRGGSTCNFGNTGTFAIIGGLAPGLSFTSTSGVFLTDTGAPGAVPEPASWALLIAGFGLVGAVQRRRARTVAA
jgi:hypothetical protein